MFNSTALICIGNCCMFSLTECMNMMGDFACDLEAANGSCSRENMTSLECTESCTACGECSDTATHINCSRVIVNAQ